MKSAFRGPRDWSVSCCLLPRLPAVLTSFSAPLFPWSLLDFFIAPVVFLRHLLCSSSFSSLLCPFPCLFLLYISQCTYVLIFLTSSPCAVPSVNKSSDTCPVLMPVGNVLVPNVPVQETKTKVMIQTLQLRVVQTVARKTLL